MHRIAAIIVNALAGGIVGRLIFIGIAASSGCKCGGNTISPADDAGVESAQLRICYEPADPLLAYSCDGPNAHCEKCPASCDVDGFEAGAGVCK